MQAIDFPMTQLERGLKECLYQRPEMMAHILTAQELADYTEWMAKEYGGSIAPQAKADMISDINADLNGPLMDLGKRILSDPSDPRTIKQLSDRWGNQYEDSYIHPDQDISAWKMLRYMPAHWHQNQFFEIYYSISGECPVYFSNEIVTVKPGTVLIVAPNVIHANPCYADDRVLVYYMIRSSTFDQVFWKQIPSGNLLSAFFHQALSGTQPNSYLHFETDHDPEIRDLLQGIFSEYQAEQRYSSQLMNAYMSACFVLLLRRYEGTARLPRTEAFYWKHEYSAILSYIQTHFDTVSLADLAERFHYSEKQIRRIVVSYTDMNFSNLIIKLRMERAATLLQRRDVAMEAIASAAGYTTVSSFYRAFSAYYGCTPGAYRLTSQRE